MFKWLHSLLFADFSEPAASQESRPGLSAGDIGFAVGVGGGTVADAVQLQYVLSCVVPPGEEATDEQIARAVGMLGRQFRRLRCSKRSRSANRSRRRLTPLSC